MIFQYNKSGEIHTLGQAGRLNCINTWWLLPGDTFNLDFGGLYRMPNMRKYMWSPVDVRMFAFFIPAAWVFEQFRTSLNGHMRNPFNTDGFADASACFHDNDAFALQNPKSQFFHWLDGSPKTTGVYPVSISLYHMVWNEWFRDINLQSKLRTDISATNFASAIATQYNSSSDGIKNYGQPVCNLPNIFANFNDNSMEVEDQYKTDITASELDLVELQQQAQTIKSVQEYYNIAQRYRDQLAKKFPGASVSHEADPRPYLLGMREMEFGGHDIDATGTNIGETQAKSTGRLEFNLQDTMVGEHGFLQLYIVPRFKPIYEQAVNPIFSFMDNHPEEMLAVPEYISQQKPLPVSLSDFFNSKSFVDIANIPSGEVHRWGYSYAHRRFHEVEAGFPLLKTPTDILSLIQCDPDDWNRMFVSQALGNYSVQSFYRMSLKSSLPPSSSSMMAGANLGA